jgi:hypothetical protein
VGTEIGPLATGDLNLDGYTDILAGATISNTLAVLLGNGDGTIRTALLTIFGGSVTDLALADFTGDRRPDVLAVLGGAGAALDILPSRGDGSFEAPIVFAVYPSGFAVAPDFNRDGKAELLFTGGSSVKPANVLEPSL